MNIKIQDKEKAAVVPQYIDRDWFNELLSPCLEFSFELDGGDLLFKASRLAAATVHPDAALGNFQPELWMYDVVEFFMARADGSRYMEFNLSPNGAWWAEVFCAARQVEAGVEALTGVRCAASQKHGAWCCEARLPLLELERLGIDVHDCRLAFCAIQNTPEQMFLTTAENQLGEPDFHQPANWPLAELL